MTDKRPLPPLTSLRFFVAFSIVLFHAAGYWGLPGRDVLSSIGVELFFILSGFILAYNYRSIPRFTEALRIIGYRIARIWPLHIVTLAAAFVIMPASQAIDPEKLWAIVPLIHAWLGNFVYALAGNNVSWTISVEFAFYLLFPLMTVMSSRGIVVFVLVITAAVAIAIFQFRGVPIETDAVSASAIARVHPAAFLVQFAAGMLACRLFLDSSWQVPFWLATVLEMLAVALTVVYFFEATEILLWIRTFDLRPVPLGWLVSHACAVVFLTPVIFILAIGRGAVSRILSTPALMYLGEISFATYMCHYLILELVIRHGLGPVGYLGGVLLGSAALYHGVERPAQRLIRQRIDGLLSSPEKPVPHSEKMRV